MSDISEKIKYAVSVSVKEAFGEECPDQMVMVERPRDPKMGDYSTNIAMRLAKSLHKKPVDIANELIEVLKKNLTEASEVSVAGPGFINFKINESALSACINQIIDFFFIKGLSWLLFMTAITRTIPEMMQMLLQRKNCTNWMGMIYLMQL